MNQQDKRNPFGGKNPHGMYVPLTDDELEVLERLALAGEFKLVIKDWGHVTGFALQRFDPATWRGNPIVTFGDKRISFYFRLDFDAPVVPQPNWYFDVEVWAMGHRLFAQRMPTETNGQPLQVAAGLFVALALDVALDRIDPRIVKEIKPKAVGLTTRHGNMHLDGRRRRLLAQTQAGERRVRELSAKEAARATEEQKKATGQ